MSKLMIPLLDIILTCCSLWDAFLLTTFVKSDCASYSIFFCQIQSGCYPLMSTISEGFFPSRNWMFWTLETLCRVWQSQESSREEILNPSSWPVSVWFYALCCCNSIGWYWIIAWTSRYASVPIVCGCWLHVTNVISDLFSLFLLSGRWVWCADWGLLLTVGE